MQTTDNKSAWINILSKGVITIPKKMRKKVGLREGDVARIAVRGNEIVITSKPLIEYRVYTDKDLARWEKEERLSPEEEKELAKEIKELWPDMP